MNHPTTDLATTIHLALLTEFRELPKTIAGYRLENRGSNHRGDWWSFRGDVKVPRALRTLFSSLRIELSVSALPQNDKDPDTLYYVRASWGYDHPGGGYNGKTFAVAWVKRDGSVTVQRSAS